MVKKLPAMWETRIQSLSWEDPLEKDPLQYSGLENSTDCIVHGVTKSWARLIDFHFQIIKSVGFPGSSDSKESVCNAGDSGSIPGSGRSPGEGNGYPFQYSCLENSLDRGAWWATVLGVAKSWTQLSD